MLGRRFGTSLPKWHRGVWVLVADQVLMNVGFFMLLPLLGSLAFAVGEAFRDGRFKARPARTAPKHLAPLPARPLAALASSEVTAGKRSADRIERGATTVNGRSDQSPSDP